MVALLQILAFPVFRLVSNGGHHTTIAESSHNMSQETVPGQHKYVDPEVAVLSKQPQQGMQCSSNAMPCSRNNRHQTLMLRTPWLGSLPSHCYV